MRMTVDLPEPFGPRNPKIEPLRDLEADMIDGGEMAEPLRQVLAFNHEFGGHGLTMR